MFMRYSGQVKEYVQGAMTAASPDHCLTMWPFSSHHQNGRPQMGWDGRKVSTVHYAFYLLHGRKAQGQLNHTCHDTTCWNPHHVYEGTQRSNIKDMDDAGRRVTPHARLTYEQADEIRSRFAAGEKGVLLASEFGVPPSTISGVVQNKIYKTTRTYSAPTVKRLSLEAARDIRARHRDGAGVRALAEAFDVSATSISKIINNETYREGTS